MTIRVALNMTHAGSPAWAGPNDPVRRVVMFEEPWLRFVRGMIE